MSWENVEKKAIGRGRKRGGLWNTVPAVAITKTSLFCNSVFESAFLNGRRGALVMIDRDAKRIGIKVPGEQDDSAFKWQQASCKSKKHKYCFITVKKIQATFPDCIGYDYRAHLNPKERVIEIDLSPENRI